MDQRIQKGKQNIFLNSKKKEKNESMEEGEGEITKGHEETFRGVEYAHHLYYGNGFTDIYIWQNLSNSIL